MSSDKLCYMQDKSCGGCCYDDISEMGKEGLVDIFRYRHLCFKMFLNGRNDVAGYESEILKREEIATIETDGVSIACAYLGFLNDEETHVGCLAHPEMNGGVDLRDHGFYRSVKLCENFFCSAAELYQSLTLQEKELFKILVSDWTWYELSNRASILGLMNNFVKGKETIASKLKTKEIQPKNIVEMKGLVERVLEEVKSLEKNPLSQVELKIQEPDSKKQKPSLKSIALFIKTLKDSALIFWKGFKKAFFFGHRS